MADSLFELVILLFRLALHGMIGATDSQRGCWLSCGALLALVSGIAFLIVSFITEQGKSARWGELHFGTALGCAALFVVFGISAGVLKWIDE